MIKNGTNTSSSEEPYSVMILIIDAMSQQNLLRSLPLTKSYLDAQGGILFTGHHKEWMLKSICL